MIRAGRPHLALAIGVCLAGASAAWAPPASAAAVKIWVDRHGGGVLAGRGPRRLRRCGRRARRRARARESRGRLRGRSLRRGAGQERGALRRHGRLGQGPPGHGGRVGGHLGHAARAGSHGPRSRPRRPGLRGRLAGRQGLSHPERARPRSTTTPRRSTSGRSPSRVRISTWRPGFPARSIASARADRASPCTRRRTAHVRALYVDATGRIWAGTSGSGLVLRIDKTGRVTTLYDSSKPEITAIAGDASGRVWVAAGAADMSSSASEPISVPVASAPAKSARGGSGTDEEDRSKPEVTVSVSTPRLAPSRGGSRGGYSAEVAPLRGRRAAPGRLERSRGGRLRPRPRTRPAPAWWRRRGPRESSTRSCPTAPRSCAPSTRGRSRSSPARTWASTPPPLSIGGVRARSPASTFPRSRTRAGPAGSARSAGKAMRLPAPAWSFRSARATSATPDSTWSAWSNWEGSARSLPIAAPDARFLQWKLRVETDGNALPRIRRTEAAYRNRNAAPVVESVVALEPAEILARSGSSGSNVYRELGAGREGHLHEPRGAQVPTARPASSSARATGRCSGRRPIRTRTRSPTTSSSGPPPARSGSCSGRTSARAPIPSTRRRCPTATTSSASRLPTPSRTRATGRRRRASPRPVRIDNTPPAIRDASRQPDVLQIEVADAASPAHGSRVQPRRPQVDAGRGPGRTRGLPDGDVRHPAPEGLDGRLPARPRHGRLAQRRDGLLHGALGLRPAPGAVGESAAPA